MAKAQITAADGTEINLEGSPSEIAEVLRDLKVRANSASRPPKTSIADKHGPGAGRQTLSGLLDELVGEQFFKKPKGIGDVRTRLGDLGHHYPLTSLSGPLMHYVRKRRLRRFKDGAKYKYSQ